MKSLLKVVVALCFATICAGCAYAHYTAEPGYVIETKTFVAPVHSGDCFDNILLNFYNYENEGVVFEEFKDNTLRLEANKKLLNKHGYLKMLEPGDKITIVCKVKVAK